MRHSNHGPNTVRQRDNRARKELGRLQNVTKESKTTMDNTSTNRIKDISRCQCGAQPELIREPDDLGAGRWVLSCQGCDNTSTGYTTETVFKRWRLESWQSKRV